ATGGRGGGLPRYAARASAPASAPTPSAATSRPSVRGPPARTSRANTERSCWYGKSNTFIAIVINRTARAIGLAHAAARPLASVAKIGAGGAAGERAIRPGRPNVAARPTANTATITA